MSRITTDLDAEDYSDVPTAYQTAWYKCDHCLNLHIVLKDQDGDAFATANLSEAMLRDMLRTLREGNA